MLANCLVDHAAARGAVLSTDPLLRYRGGHSLTSRRYDHLWKRLGERLLWVAAQGISTHWLRHTTLTWVERHFGYGIARAYAGHTDNTGPATTYKDSLEEVVTALAVVTRQSHPLALLSFNAARGVSLTPANPNPISLAHLTIQRRHLLTSDSWKSPGKREISYEWGFPPSDTSFGEITRIARNSANPQAKTMRRPFSTPTPGSPN